MSDSMLHGILQMPPELWTNDAIDIAQRHGRYLEASKRIIELERERDEARMELKRLKKELVSVNRGAETNAKINQSLAKKLHDLEGYAARTRDHLQASSTMHRETMNERDEARRERDEAMNALRWIAGAYCHEKSTFQLALMAYEMSSKARWTIQKIEQKEEA